MLDRPILKYFWLIIIVFLYIYNPAFVFLPPILRTRVIIGLIGVCVYWKELLTYKNSRFILLLELLLLPVFPILLTTLINENFDSRFLGNMFQNVIYLCGAYYIIKRILPTDFITFVKLLVIVIFVHNILALLMFFYEPLFLNIIKIQHIDPDLENALSSTIQFKARIVGIGLGSYFLGGVFSAIGLILTMFLITQSKGLQMVSWFAIYIFIFITGLFIARTTLLGVMISTFYLLYYWFTNNNFLIFVSKLVIISFSCIGLVAFFLFLKNYFIDDPLFRFAFELFINYFESNGVETRSTTDLQQMFIFPDNLKTFLIGDGLFSNPDNTYYMHTDVGYSRLLFYYGIGGAVIYFLPQLYITAIYIYSSNKKEIKALIFLLFIFVLVANIKGLLDLNWLMFLFFWFFLLEKKTLKSS